MKRSEAREYVFIMLFQYKFQPEQLEEIIEEFKEKYDCTFQEEYIDKALRGTVEKTAELDKLINEASVDWTTDRMSYVRLSVLRLAVYEMLYMQDIPRPIIINEAVRISKIYDGDESAPFINGVLDFINKKYPANHEEKSDEQ